MPYEELPIRGGFVSNVQPTALKARPSEVINWWLDANGYPWGRPGLRRWCEPIGGMLVIGGGSARIIGLFAFREWLIAVSELRRVFRIAEDQSYIDITGERVLPGNLPPQFLVDQDGSLIILGGGTPLRYTGDGTADVWGDSMPQASCGAILAHYLLLNNVDTDRIDFSDPGDHSHFDVGGTGPATDPAGWFVAENRNDPVLAMFEQWGELWLFGSSTLEHYYGTGEPDAPFSWNSTIPRGIAGPRAVVLADETFYWLGDDRRVFRLGKDGTPEVLSFEIAPTLLDMVRVDDCLAYHVHMGGRHLVAFVFPAAETTLIYDGELSARLEGQTWYEWRGWNGNDWQAFSMLSYAEAWGRHFVSSALADTGIIYELAEDAYDDDGAAIRRIITTAPVDHGGVSKQKIAWELRAKMLRGRTSLQSTVSGSPPALSSLPQGSNPSLLVRTRELGSAWGNPRPMAIGRRGDVHATDAVLRRCGSYRTREWQIECSDPVPIGIGGIEEWFELEGNERE